MGPKAGDVLQTFQAVASGCLQRALVGPFSEALRALIRCVKGGVSGPNEKSES